MSITYKAIDPESGIRWCVRIVFEGDGYGLNHCLTHDETEPMIEFYDMDSMAAVEAELADRAELERRQVQHDYA